MKCYGLAIRFDKEPFTWYFPGNKLFAFFANNLAESSRKEITDFCDHKVRSGEVHYYDKDSYCFSVLKVQKRCCIVASDCKLNKRQMAYLYMYLLETKLPMQTVADNLEKYTQDVKIAELTKILTETNVLMGENIEQLLKRQGNLEQLLANTDEIAHRTEEFKHKSHELNSCCTIL